MKKFLMICLIFLVGLTSCNAAQSRDIESLAATVAAVDAVRTSVAKTVDALSTHLASTPVLSTPTLQETGLVSLTQTPPVKTVLSTQTIPAGQTPGSSLTKAPCDWLGLVRDVTIPDGTYLFPNTVFMKTWEFTNSGSCTWNAQYSLVFTEGEKMNAVPSIPLVEGAKTVAPGQSVQVSIQMTAPGSTGKKTGYWKLQNPSGYHFGVGVGGSKSFWVDINVSTSVTLLNNMCFAEWRNATEPLACPGKMTDAKGSVSRVDNPKFAGGYVENEPAILMVPQMVTNGYLVGKFPPMIVPKSDFVLLVACASDSPQCNARVILTAQEGNTAEKTLVDVVKTASNGTSSFSIDMSANGLVGKSVTFRLYVRANGNATDDRIYWVNPAFKLR